MAEQTLVKTLVALCEGGQCAGEVTLVTDGANEAYAVVEPDRGKYVSQDCDGIEKRRDGSIVVTCAAYNPDAEERCDGVATFTRADLDATHYAADAAANYMHPMEVEDAAPAAEH